MSTFRKKSVVIEAFQMTRERRKNPSEWPTWLKEAWDKEAGELGSVYPSQYSFDKTDKLLVQTLEGFLIIGWDDWIIQGVKGELYPCKPDIFAETYELVP